MSLGDVGVFGAWPKHGITREVPRETGNSVGNNRSSQISLAQAFVNQQRPTLDRCAFGHLGHDGIRLRSQIAVRKDAGG